ncbi:Aquaporin-1 [Aspergillus niger]
MGPQQWFRKRNPDSQTAPMYRSSNNQLPMLHLADTTRNNFIAAVGEFVGTFLFLFFSFAGTQVSNTPKPAPGSPPNTSNLLYSSLCFGFSLMVNVWAFYRVTGGLFNPAVCPAIPMSEFAIDRDARSLWPCVWLADYLPSVGLFFSEFSSSQALPLPVSWVLCSQAT